MYSAMEHVTLFRETVVECSTCSMATLKSAPTLKELRDILDDAFDTMLRFKDKGLIYTRSLDWFSQVRDIRVDKSDVCYKIAGRYTDVNDNEIHVLIRYLIWE